MTMNNFMYSIEGHVRSIVYIQQLHKWCISLDDMRATEGHFTATWVSVMCETVYLSDATWVSEHAMPSYVKVDDLSK
jgi:hypothetical protein